MYFKELEKKCEAKNSLLCVGLDPRIDQGLEKTAARDAIIEGNKKLIGQTAEYTVVYKPNSAFFEAYGPYGFEALEKTLEMIPQDIDILMDSKRGDIGSTAEAYAKSIFGYFNADAVTINPYMGRDAFDPFLAYEGKGIWSLCRTSNPGASAFQDLKVEDEELYFHVAREVCRWSPDIGLVVAGNKYEDLRRVRAENPEAWFLSPGIGAQGGKMEEAIRAGMNSRGYGILPVVVRGIAHAQDPAKAAKDYRDALNETREAILG